jgi:hypothetical protein
MSETRADYRTALNHTLLALEDGGYGDFDYEDADLDFFLEVAVARLFPALYQKVSESKTLADYGTQGYSSVTPTQPDRVYRIEDSVERTALLGWRVSGTDIINLDKCQSVATISTVTVFYYDAYTLPADDATDVTWSAMFKPLIILAAQIEALTARQDTGVRGDPPPTGQFMETSLLDRLIPRYETLRNDMAMSLPGVQF